MNTLTHEQLQVVQSNAKILAVDAFAGSGKTSTLVHYAKARPKERILYIAFNKSVATEARDRFPDNVDCRTTHSLAFAAQGRQYSEKLGNAQPFQIAQQFSCAPRRAKLALDTVNSWLCSTDECISADHVDRDSVEKAGDVVLIAELAQKIWEQMKSHHSAIRMPHDGYLKLWAMSQPRLNYDVILLDEAQDTNPLTLELVLAQKKARIVLVGDRHQGIYGFRKAMNAMQFVHADERVAITRSFRFGQGIAEVATKLLQSFKDEVLSVTGRDDIDVSWKVDTQKHYALLGRTNAGLFAAAASTLKGRDPKLHFVGGFDSYVFGKVLDAYYLWADERSKIKDSGIARFPNFSDFKEYGEEAGDAETKALVKTVEAYRNDVPAIYNALKAAETPLQERATITLATAHKAKGLEWDQVKLSDDFIELPPEEDFDPEELNLLYVALTRAIRSIELPSSLSQWLKSQAEESSCSQPSVSISEPPPPQVQGEQIGPDHEAWLRINHG